MPQFKRADPRKQVEQWVCVCVCARFKHTIRTYFHAIKMLWLKIFESNKNKTLILRKIKWKMLFTQSNWNQLQWKFCVKISSGIDSILLTKRTHKMKWNKMKRAEEEEEDDDNNDRGDGSGCERGKNKMYVYVFPYGMNEATRASDGIFKTVISNVLLCKRPPQILYYTFISMLWQVCWSSMIGRA